VANERISLSGVPKVIPQAFGARGNGEYNDTSALVSAVEHIQNLTVGGERGGMLFIPRGKYKLDPDVLTLTQSVEIVAENPDDCIIEANGPGTSLITLGEKYAGVHNIRVNCPTGMTVERMVTIAALGTVNGRNQLHNVRGEGFGYGVYNAGADGWEVTKCELNGMSLAAVNSVENGLNATIDVRVNGFSSGGDGIVFNSTSQQPEGVTISGKILTPGGSPLKVYSGLSFDINATLDQFDQGVLLDGTNRPVASIRFNGGWIGPKSSAAASYALRCRGNVTHARLFGTDVVADEYPAIWLDGASVLDFAAFGARVRHNGETADSIGLLIDAAKRTIFVGGSVTGGSGARQSLKEINNPTSVFFGTHFEAPPAASDRSPYSVFTYNFGLFEQDSADGPYTTHTDETRGRTVTIADDGVYSFDPAINTGIVTVSLDDGACEFGYRVSEAASACAISIANASAQFAATTGALTGTTGTDDRVTVSAHTDGKIYVENRRGGSRTVRIMVRG